MPPCFLDQIPLVDGKHQRAAFALDQVGDAQILFLELVLGVHHQHDDFGETHGAQRVGDGQLLQLLLDTRTTTQTGGVENAEIAALVVELHRNAESRVVPASGRGQQALFAEQIIDRGRLAGVGAPDNGDADRSRLAISSSGIDDVIIVVEFFRAPATGSGISTRSAS